MSKHTPAPWKAVECTTNGSKGFEIHYSEDGECITDHVYEEADANLIAAAPDMLEALNRIADITDYYSGEMASEAKDIAQQAIAKAEGTS